MQSLADALLLKMLGEITQRQTVGKDRGERLLLESDSNSFNRYHFMVLVLGGDTSKIRAAQKDDAPLRRSLSML